MHQQFRWEVFLVHKKGVHACVPVGQAPIGSLRMALPACVRPATVRALESNQQGCMSGLGGKGCLCQKGFSGEVSMCLRYAKY